MEGGGGGGGKGGGGEYFFIQVKCDHIQQLLKIYPT